MEILRVSWLMCSKSVMRRSSRISRQPSNREKHPILTQWSQGYSRHDATREFTQSTVVTRHGLMVLRLPHQVTQTAKGGRRVHCVKFWLHPHFVKYKCSSHLPMSLLPFGTKRMSLRLEPLARRCDGQLIGRISVYRPLWPSLDKTAWAQCRKEILPLASPSLQLNRAKRSGSPSIFPGNETRNWKSL